MSRGTSRAAVVRARDLRIVRGDGPGRFELQVDALDLHAGDTLAILGPNGAGKTSLLLALAGLLEPQQGRIERGEGPVTMVFQRPLAFDGTVTHNIEVALLDSELGPAARSERVREAMLRFGLRSLGRRNASSLSGGELRRLALARAMARRPRVLLLDEPFDDLDPMAQDALAADLERLVRETGIALAIVSHDLRRASALARCMAVLDRGRLEQTGTIGEVLSAPVNAEVARLVGMTNLLAGRVVARQGETTARVELGPDVCLQVRCSLPEGAPIWVGIRPERLKLDFGRGTSAPIGDGRIRTLRSDSLLTRLTLDFAGQELHTHLVSGRGPARTLAVGERVTLSVLEEDLWVMPREAPLGGGRGLT